MNSKNNRKNHDFQIQHFLAGSCHTPDGAYALLCDLREERQLAIAESAAHALRTEAKCMRARRRLDDSDEAERLEGAADLAEVKAHAEVVACNLAAARAEVACIEATIAQLQPHRRFSDLSDPEAHEAAQRDEWKLELIARAENFLATSGSIPAGEFVTMRQHPDFLDFILPAIEATRIAIAGGRMVEALKMTHHGAPAERLPSD